MLSPAILSNSQSTGLALIAKRRLQPLVALPCCYSRALRAKQVGRMSPYQPPDDGKPPASYTAAINLLLLPKPANRPPPFTRLRRPHVAEQCGPAAADMISGEEFAAGAQQLAAHWARGLPGERGTLRLWRAG